MYPPTFPHPHLFSAAAQLAQEPAQQFELTGILKIWLQEPGHRAKGFWLETAQGEYLIKLTKAAWQQLLQSWSGLPTEGSPVRMMGKCKAKDGKLKLKAQKLYSVSSSPLGQTAPAKILICQKSDCCRRGSMEVKQAVIAQLEKCGLAHQVKVQSIGCLGSCKQGPNLMLMPGKAKITRLSPADVPHLVATYFPQTLPPVCPRRVDATR